MSQPPKRHLDWLRLFVQLTGMSDTQTHRPTLCATSVAIGRISWCVCSDVPADDERQKVRPDVQSDGQQGSTGADSTQCQPGTRLTPGRLSTHSSYQCLDSLSKGSFAPNALRCVTLRYGEPQRNSFGVNTFI